MRGLERSPVLLRNWNLKPIFEQGLLIYAWGSADKIRIVNIIDPEKHYDSPHKIGAGYAAIGKGSTIDSAMLHALISFHNNLSHDDMYGDQNSSVHLPDGNNKSDCRLDYWILHHNGTMSATKDEDGTILCTLEGNRQPASNNYDQITLYGEGLTLSIALRKAFQNLDSNLITV